MLVPPNMAVLAIGYGSEVAGNRLSGSFMRSHGILVEEFVHCVDDRSEFEMESAATRVAVAGA